MTSETRGDAVAVGAVEFRGVTKRYVVGSSSSRVNAALPGRFSHPTTGGFAAVADLDLRIEPGETVGIIGPNGAGKSTVLKMLAGVVAPTSGTIRHGGRLGQMIELGLGFHPELTGSENIELSATILGLSREEIAARRASIVEFAGIGDALDTPLKRYSTGMKARLGFAVTTEVTADVLAVDEVLSVGDQEFQRRCMERILARTAAGGTLLFVSHAVTLVERLCQRVVRLDGGRAVDDGPAAEVIDRYLMDSSRGLHRSADHRATISSLALAEPMAMPREPLRIELGVDFAATVPAGTGPTPPAASAVPAASPPPAIDVTVELSAPTFTPGYTFSRAVATLPPHGGPGAYRFRGLTSPIPFRGGHVRMTVELVEAHSSVLLDRRSCDFEVGGGDGGFRPYLAATVDWSLSDDTVGSARPATPPPAGPDDAAPLVAVADHVTKRYRSGLRRPSPRLALPGRFGEPPECDVIALDDVSVAIRFGEAIGIIGANGAGKSTLLKLLAGIVAPTEGSASTFGRVVSITELGAGFHPDATGAENLALTGLLLGLSDQQLTERTPEIVAFAGIEDAMDRQVKHYSSGMRARLGFSIAAHVDVDLLLVDEVLSVGDAEFRARALRRVAQLRARGVALVFVSHDLELVSEFCERAVILERGRVIEVGLVDDVVAEYGGTGWAAGSNSFDPRLRLHELTIERRRVPTGEPVSFRGRIEVREPCPTCRIEVSYRETLEDRSVEIDADQREEMTFMTEVVEPAGGLARPGWFAFTGAVHGNEVFGPIDLVVGVIDESRPDDPVVAEAFDSFVLARGTPVEDHGTEDTWAHLDVSWSLEPSPARPSEPSG